MGDFTPFFLGIAAAAATLAGLLFIAVQFNIESLVDNPASRWFAVARSTYSTYVLLLLVPLVLVLPGVDPAAAASVLVIAAVLGAFGAIRTWLPVWRSVVHHQERLWQSFWLLLSPLIAYSLLGWNGYALYTAPDPKPVLRIVGYIFIVHFAIALRNSWRILVEVAIERRTTTAATQAQNPGKGKP